ncbi:hypothetical protein BST81_05780 [Leptolyngbya sp. 'hensonii']|uniref:hypothetical protein n=1 Tax=Leptolyngbya sp. 'hensonii' TaxID=1922337 RepID=UPI00094FE952|nr:hypothetical protein [Leptolyngbya sp. 'hensonii']OLP19413.1 hypothetical protein BST81_05780 [Leptolyngbya sp. 'hensonii']
MMTNVEIMNLVHQFEACTLPRSQWDHAAHLTVALWYLICFPDAEAVLRICQGIQRYNKSQGIGTTPTGGYHETLTLFWIAIVRQFLAESNPELSLAARAHELILKYGERKNLFRESCSLELIRSPATCQNWAPPDLN